LPSGSRADSTLIATGFENWKKAKDKFRAHEKVKLTEIHEMKVKAKIL